MLTPKQHRLLLYISEQVKNNGYAPSYDEMRDALGLRSKSGVHRLVTSLEERKFIRRLPHKARAIEVLRMPGDEGAEAGAFGDHDGSVAHGQRR